MITVPADIAGQSEHATDWLDGRKEQGPSPVLARAKRQLEELEVDWAASFAVPETESVTVPRPKKKRTQELAATSHLPPAISASHTAKPPHPPGKVLAQKTANQQLLAQAAQRVQRQAEQAKKKEDEAKEKKKEEEEKRKKKEKEEEEKRKKKEKEEEERRKKKEKEEDREETEESRGGESRKGNAVRAIVVIARAMHFVARAMLRIARAMPVLCLCATLSRQARRHCSRHPSRSSHQSQHRSSLSQSQTSHKNKEVRAVPPHQVRLPRPSSRAEPMRIRRQEMSSCSAEIGPTKKATSLGGSSTAPLRSRR